MPVKVVVGDRRFSFLVATTASYGVKSAEQGASCPIQGEWPIEGMASRDEMRLSCPCTGAPLGAGPALYVVAKQPVVAAVGVETVLSSVSYGLPHM